LIHRKSWGIYAPLMIKNAYTLHRVSAAHLWNHTKENSSMLVAHYSFALVVVVVSMVALLIAPLLRRLTPASSSLLTRRVNREVKTGRF
jgi:hypothetical protein